VRRLCATCGQQRPLRDFDLGEGLRRTCLACAGETAPHQGLLSRERRAAQLDDLEQRRRSLIASLVKIDAEIAVLRAARTEPFSRVDSSDVFDNSDSDLGSGD
jgi:hypothetical protein